MLFGVRDNDVVQVSAYRRLACDHAFGPTFTLGDADDQRIGQVIAEAAGDALLRDLAPVGWFRSRTRSELVFDEQDHQILERWFPEEWQTGLVIKPELNHAARAAIFFRDRTCGQVVGSVEFAIAGGGQLRPAERRELPAPVTLPSAAPPTPSPAVQAAPEPMAIDPPMPVIRGLDRASIRESEKPRESAWSWRAVAAVLVALVAGAAGGVAGSLTYGEKLLHGDRIALAAKEDGGQLHVRWNHEAKAVLEARTAVLEIREGDSFTPITLDRDMLRRGSVFYQRQGRRVDLTLTLQDERSQTKSDLISYVAPAGPNAPESR